MHAVKGFGIHELFEHLGEMQPPAVTVEGPHGAFAASVWAIPLATAVPEVDDHDRARNERLRDAFWHFADEADP